MTAGEATALQEKVRHFIPEYAGDNYCLKLLRFFGTYPCARFSRLTIIHVVGTEGGRLHLEEALGRLVDKKVVKVYTVNGISLYSLTEEESLQCLAVELACLDWCEWRLICS